MLVSQLRPTFLGPVVWGVWIVTAIGTVILAGSYLYLRGKFEPVTDHRSFHVFTVIYFVGSAAFLLGPIASALTVNRFEPISTPLGSIDPPTVVSLGLSAVPVGLGLLLVAIISLRWVNKELEAR